MLFANSVNAGGPAPDTFWCVPGLAKFRTQYVILDRCTSFDFERLDCLEFVSQWSSLRVADHFDTLSAARGMFEFTYEYEPVLETLRSKPLPFDAVRTVEIRDWCGGDSNV